MTKPYASRRLDQRTIEDADQAEFAAFVRQSAVIDTGIYDDRIAGALDDFEPEDSTVHLDWQRQDLQYDTAVGRIHEELSRRSQMMGASYPFDIEDNKLIHSASASGFYEFCLATCCANTITAGDFVGLPRAFERATALLLKSYLGEHATWLHTGSPRDRDVGTTFRDAMMRLNALSGEWIWGPEPDLPDDPSTTGDEGMDFVVWIPSPDKRAGQLFILGQCACGDDWEGKFNDLSLDKLRKWFRPGWYVTPARAFATPHHLSDGHLLNAQREAGLVLDRARLTLIAEHLAGDESLRVWRPRFSELAALVVGQSRPQPPIRRVSRKRGGRTKQTSI